MADLDVLITGARSAADRQLSNYEISNVRFTNPFNVLSSPAISVCAALGSAVEIARQALACRRDAPRLARSIRRGQAAQARAYSTAHERQRRCGREAEGGGLLNRYRVVKPYRGFESLRLRQVIENLSSSRLGHRIFAKNEWRPEGPLFRSASKWPECPRRLETDGLRRSFCKGSALSCGIIRSPTDWQSPSAGSVTISALGACDQPR
jgi:hypothetical protein